MHFHTATVNFNPFFFLYHGFLGNKLDILYVQLELFHFVATQQQLPGLKTNKHRANLHSALGQKLFILFCFLSLHLFLCLSPPFFALYSGVWWVD